VCRIRPRTWLTRCVRRSWRLPSRRRRGWAGVARRHQVAARPRPGVDRRPGRRARADRRPRRSQRRGRRRLRARRHRPLRRRRPTLAAAEPAGDAAPAGEQRGPRRPPSSGLGLDQVARARKALCLVRRRGCVTLGGHGLCSAHATDADEATLNHWQSHLYGHDPTLRPDLVRRYAIGRPRLNTPRYPRRARRVRLDPRPFYLEPWRRKDARESLLLRAAVAEERGPFGCFSTCVAPSREAP
jgi:hypothetical protein